MTRKEAIALLVPNQEASDVVKATRFIEWLELLGILVLEEDEE